LDAGFGRRSLLAFFNVLAHREQFHQSRLVKESMPQIFIEYSCDEVLRRQGGH
jgi:hypothetical protein